ncbi:hypothetical protein CSUI_002270 [Cystoisospora suis]|uniref:Uncharacterized protein n=1 Tax=Cystoisospora suis TaxID=483139 RepID=A0A2C6L9H8_9APIC|nr:hypothetical protein CSUI_002270 [Cystoisospora suis]
MGLSRKACAPAAVMASCQFRPCAMSSGETRHVCHHGLNSYRGAVWLLFAFTAVVICSLILVRGPTGQLIQYGSAAEAKPKRSDKSQAGVTKGSIQKSGVGRTGRDTKEAVVLASKRPTPLPEDRVLKALSMFEDVHGQMTLFFKGFSRRGSVIAYDLLDELRTVKEATLMMDVEFLVLDRVMDHYKSPTHLRVVDTTVFSKLLNLSNLLPWRIPGLLSDIRRLVLEYQPVLQQFLNRYDPVIEALILINIPRALSGLRPVMAALLGVPREKLIFAMNLRDLEKYIPLKDIPREFWNPKGGPVRDGRENRVSWGIMLEEVEAKLGAAALKPAGKLLLQQIREEQAAASSEAGSAADGARDTRTPDPEEDEEEFPDLDEGLVNEEVTDLAAELLPREDESPEGTQDGLTADVLDADFDDID